MGTRTKIQPSGIVLGRRRVSDHSTGKIAIAGPLAKAVEKLQKLDLAISEEKGPLWLFALFLREDSIGKWDVVVAAPWVSSPSGDTLEFIAEKLKSAFGARGMMMFSRIITFEKRDPFVVAANELVEVVHGLVEVNNLQIDRVDIERGYIFTSSKLRVAKNGRK